MRIEMEKATPGNTSGSYLLGGTRSVLSLAIGLLLRRQTQQKRETAVTAALVSRRDLWSFFFACVVTCAGPLLEESLAEAESWWGWWLALIGALALDVTWLGLLVGRQNAHVERKRCGMTETFQRRLFVSFAFLPFVVWPATQSMDSANSVAAAAFGAHVIFEASIAVVVERGRRRLLVSRASAADKLLRPMLWTALTRCAWLVGAIIAYVSLRLRDAGGSPAPFVVQAVYFFGQVLLSCVALQLLPFDRATRLRRPQTPRHVVQVGAGKPRLIASFSLSAAQVALPAPLPPAPAMGARLQPTLQTSHSSSSGPAPTLRIYLHEPSPPPAPAFRPRSDTIATVPSLDLSGRTETASSSESPDARHAEARRSAGSLSANASLATATPTSTTPASTMRTVGVAS